MRIRLYKIFALVVLSVYLIESAYALPESSIKNTKLPISSKFIFIPEDLNLTFPSGGKTKDLPVANKTAKHETPLPSPTSEVSKEAIPDIKTPKNMLSAQVHEPIKTNNTVKESTSLTEGGYLLGRKASIKNQSDLSIADTVSKYDFSTPTNAEKTVPKNEPSIPAEKITSQKSADIISLPQKSEVSTLIPNNTNDIAQNTKADTVAPAPILNNNQQTIATKIYEPVKDIEKTSANDNNKVADIFYIPVEKSGFVSNEAPVFPSVASNKKTTTNENSQIAYGDNSAEPAPTVEKTLARADIITHEGDIINPVKPKSIYENQDYDSEKNYSNPWKVAKTSSRARIANNNYDDLTKNSEQLASTWSKLPTKQNSIDMPEVDGTLLVHEEEQETSKTKKDPEKMIKLSDYDVSVAQLEKEDRPQSALIKVADKNSDDDFPVLEKLPDDDVPSLGDLPSITEASPDAKSDNEEKKPGKIGDLVSSISSIFGSDKAETVKNSNDDNSSSPGILEKINQKISSVVKSDEGSLTEENSSTESSSSKTPTKSPKVKNTSSFSQNSSYILPTEMRLSFQPEMASISGQTLKWFYKFTQKAKDDPDMILEIRMSSSTSPSLKNRRAAIINNILKSSNLPDSKVRLLHTDRAPNTLVLRLIKNYGNLADTNRTFYQNNTYKQW